MATLPYSALHASHAGMWIAGESGARGIDRREALSRAAGEPLILLNAPLVGQRLGYAEISGLDLLELFAFVHPARFAVPTAKGLCDALALPAPASEAEIAPAVVLARARSDDRQRGA
jgi:ATP-dependent DNA helicase DinG